MSSYRYLILGGGMVAGYAAQAFVEGGVGPGELCIVSAEASLPYERPPLSKGFMAGQARADELLINQAAFYREHGIDLRLDTPVARVDFAGKRLISAAGEAINYDKLLLATGARVRKLKLPGAGLAGVYTLRSLEDASRIREAASGARQVVVIGGGYIGTEVSASLAQRGLPITVLLSGAGLLPRLFTSEMSAFFQSYFSARGVTFIANVHATGLTGQDRAEAVELDSGQLLPADLVVAGIGVTPETSLFADTPLQLDERGITVNEYLETNLPDVYAAGDAVSYWDLIFNKRRHVEHWNNAVEGGKHVAKVMLGQREAFREIPYFFSDVFDLSWEFWGDNEAADRVIYRGQPESGSFSTWWLKDGRLMAAFVMNRPDQERELAPKWIAAGKLVSPAQLADSSQALG
ncbi:MAG: NAD(P)/FAD-dependent oxidoreductase [Candidatus Sericytochromatia bacterium]